MRTGKNKNIDIDKTLNDLLNQKETIYDDKDLIDLSDDTIIDDKIMTDVINENKEKYKIKEQIKEKIEEKNKEQIKNEKKRLNEQNSDLINVPYFPEAKKKKKFEISPDLFKDSITTKYLLNNYKNYHEIDNPIIEKPKTPLSFKDYPRVRQRSDAFWEVRGDYTASSLNIKLGLKLKYAKDYFRKKGIEKYYATKKSLTEWIYSMNKFKIDLSHIQYMLDWGTNHENNAIKDLLDSMNEMNSIIDVYEVGAYAKVFGNGKIKYTDAPDGLFIIKQFNGLVEEFDGIIEIKCPGPYSPNSKGGGWFYDPHLQPQDYMRYDYIQQMQMHMYASGRYYGIYICYTISKTNFILVEYDEEYCNMIIKLIEFLDETYNKFDEKDSTTFIEIQDPNDKKMKKCSRKYKEFIDGKITNPFKPVETLYNQFLKKTVDLYELYASDDVFKWSKVK
jgi:hypothetical protein